MVLDIKNKIIHGHALEELKKLPDECIDCVVTSPPYWSLRDYNTDPIIWGGDEKCRHEFDDIIKKDPMDRTKGGDHDISKCGIGGKWDMQLNKSGFCKKCGAWSGSLGLEPDFNLYISHLILIFDEVKRVLKKTGSCWVNLGDTFFGGGNNRGNNSPLSEKQQSNKGAVGQVQQDWSKMNYKSKCLCCIPDRFKIEMIKSGWLCRNEIIWKKDNAMPSSVKDRFSVDFEKIFFFTKTKKYYFKQQFEPMISNNYDLKRMSSGRKEYKGKWSGHGDAQSFGSPWTRTQRKSWDSKRLQSNFVAGGVNGRNKRATFCVNTKPFAEAHFAVFPEALIEPLIKAGCPKNGIVLDPFFGSGTTGVVALKQRKKFVGLELNQKYIEIATNRLKPYLEQKKLF